MSIDFKDQIKQLGDRVLKLKDAIQTEEATKNAFIMPFINALGYDVFNPLEVVPEYITDIGTKKGEKIDYAIMKDNTPVILIECKHWAQNLNIHDGQILRYFNVSKAKFAILTNGINYRFYTDLDEPNKMDEKPFLEFNINEIKENQYDELKKFHKNNFNVENIVNSASELKYTKELRTLLENELKNPSAEFTKYFAKQVYSSVVTAKVLEQFTNLLQRSIQQHISDIITDRLKNALQSETNDTNTQLNDLKQATEQPISNEAKIVTTEEETEAFSIIKSIIRTKVDISRILPKDTVNYFAINLDNTRKLVCRIYLNGNKKYFGYFDENKKEVKIEINNLNDLYNYTDILHSIIDSYLAE